MKSLVACVLTSTYTKAFTDATKWQAVFDSINIVDPKRLRQFLLEFGTDVDKDDNVGCSVDTVPHTLALSSPFAPDPVRYDNTVHEDWPRHPPGKALSRTLDRTHTVFKKFLQRGGITKILSLSSDHLKVMKTCVEGIKHGTRIGRSWGAGLKYDRFHFNGIGGPTQAGYDVKLAVDVTGSLTVMKIANAVTVINTFIAKYVGGLRWDYLPIGGECETSRWGPSTRGFDDIQEFTEGICGMICLGHANDCAGWINGMHYQQGVEGEVVCFTGVGNDVTHHFDMRPHEHDFELQPVGCHFAWEDLPYSPLHR